MGAAAQGLPEEKVEWLLGRADEALDGLREDFAREADLQVGRLDRVLEALRQGGDEATRTRHFTEAFDAAHEIRGQAGTFGYDLLSRVCESLCFVVEGRDALAWKAVDAIDHHVAAAHFIIDSDLKGDGGSTGTALMRELARLKAFITAGGSVSAHA